MLSAAGFLGRCGAVAAGSSFTITAPVFSVLTGSAVRRAGALPASVGKGKFDCFSGGLCAGHIGLVTDIDETRWEEIQEVLEDEQEEN